MPQLSGAEGTRLFLRLVLIGIGTAAILIGLFAPEKEQGLAAAWFAFP